MGTRLNPYLNFRSQTREAMAFYQSIFGGELSVLSFAEGGMPIADEEKDDVMHSQLVGEHIEFMAADVPSSMPFDGGSSVSMSLFGEDDDVLSGYFDKLADGGTNTMPLNVAPWGDKFGMVTDKFGISWMVNITGGGNTAQP